MTQPERPAEGTLWNRNFLIWWLGSAQSALGNALAGIALSFLVLKQTGSAGAMGVTLALTLLPALLAPLFGTLIDRLPILPPLLVSNLLRAAVQLGVGFAVLNGAVPISVLNVLALVGGLALGLLSALATYWFGGEYQQTIAVGVLMIVLLVRPEGLFGARGVRAV